MLKARKRTKLVYRDDPEERAAELEELLFGARGDAAAVFGERAEPADDEDVTLTDLIHKVAGGHEEEGDTAAPLFYVDKQTRTPSALEQRKKKSTLRHKHTALPQGQATQAVSVDEDHDSPSSSEGSGAGEDSDNSDEDDAATEIDREDSEEGGSGLDQEEAGVRDSDASNSVSGGEEDLEEDELGSVRASFAPSHSAAAGEAHRSGSARGLKSSAARASVWEDPADTALLVNLSAKARLRKLRSSHAEREVGGSTYEQALRKQHLVLNPRTSWADCRQPDSTARGEEDSESMASLLTSAGGLLHSGAGRLAPGTIEATRVKDGNQAELCSGVVRSCGFHPGGALLMTGSMDKKIRLFQVDGVRNPKVQVVHLADCPVHQASWASGGSQIVAAGRRPHFYVYDVQASKVERVQGPSGCRDLKSLEAFAVAPGPEFTQGSVHNEPLVAFMGDQGYMPLVSLRSRQWVGNLKMAGTARCAAFVPGTHELLSLGGDGVVNTWDLRMRRCIAQVKDHANIAPTALAVSADGKFFSTGSVSGVLNMYERQGGLVAPQQAVSSLHNFFPQTAQASALLGNCATTKQPIKELMNLTTTVDTLTFSHDAQVLAMSSRMKKDAMRLVHLPSCTVFSNWPTSRSPLHYVHSLAFSPNSGFLAVGNARGRVLLYRLHHYSAV